MENRRKIMSENKKDVPLNSEIKDEELDKISGGTDDAVAFVRFYCNDCKETSYWPAFIVGSRTKGMRCAYCKRCHTYKVES